MDQGSMNAKEGSVKHPLKKQVQQKMNSNDAAAVDDGAAVAVVVDGG